MTVNNNVTFITICSYMYIYVQHDFEIIYKKKKLKPINNYNINAFNNTTVFILLYRDIFETNLVLGLRKTI